MFGKLIARKNDIKTLAALLAETQDVAKAQGVEYQGAHHLMLAALNMPDGSARRVFAAVGANPDDFAGAVERQMADALPELDIPEAIVDVAPPPRGRGFAPTTPNADATLTAAMQATYDFHNAPENGGRLVGAYVVAGIATVSNGTAARALQAMGVDRTALMDAALVEARDAQ